ncbi:MAG TPA: guanine deaminase [Dongiaceae bacterium]|nr:guanine deaminase [Dongiaceae bacterium]
MPHPSPAATSPGIIAIRGPALTSTGNPFRDGVERTRRFESDAVVAMADGRIHAFGPADRVLPTLPAGTPVTRFADHLIVPGFIDAHVHYPQTSIVAAWGGGLLDWLERHAFPAEQRFADPAWAREVARVFLDECLRHGITSAMVYGTVHADSVDALLEEAAARSMRLIAGKVLMDRNAPAALCDGADLGVPATRELIARWHGQGRVAIAITPRFAASSTPAQLEAAGALLGEHPDLWVQTHLSENTDEIRWVRDLFPDRRDYLDVYEHHGLVGRRTVLGHGIHLSDDELRRIHERGAAIAHCPTSNLFLGSGLFDLFRAQNVDHPVRVGLATDIGAGTTFSVLGTLGEAYKVAQLRGHSLSPAHAFWLATLGTAEALALEDRIGRLAAGMEADLVVLDLRSTPLLEWRMRQVESVDDALFLQMMLADERAIRATFVAGKLVYSRPS